MRTDAPVMLSEEDKEKLLEAGFDRVVDLRSDVEVARAPGCLAEDSRFMVCRAPLAGNGRIPGSRDEVPETYMEMVRGQAEMQRALEFLADVPRGAVIHCTAGKDRPRGEYSAVVGTVLMKYRDVESYFARIGLEKKRIVGLRERLRG